MTAGSPTRRFSPRDVGRSVRDRPRAGCPGPGDLSPRGKDSARLRRRARAPGRGDRHDGDQPADRLSVCRHDDHGRGRHDPRRPLSDPCCTAAAPARRCTFSRPGDAGWHLCDQHQRPAAVRCGPAARSDHRRQLRDLRRRGRQGRRAGRQERRRLRFAQAPDRLARDTLGIITQLTLKVRPIPETSAIAWVCFRNLQAVSEALDRLNISETRPIAVELLNASAARAVGGTRGLPVGRDRARHRFRRKRPDGGLAARSLEERAEECRPHDRRRESDRPALGESDRVSGPGDRAA